MLIVLPSLNSVKEANGFITRVWVWLQKRDSRENGFARHAGIFNEGSPKLVRCLPVTNLQNKSLLQFMFLYSIVDFKTLYAVAFFTVFPIVDFKTL